MPPVRRVMMANNWEQLGMEPIKVIASYILRSIL